MEAGKILVAEHDGVHILKFMGDVRVVLCATIESFLNSMFEQPKFRSVLIDLTETKGIDSTSLGLLAKMSIQAKQRLGIVPTIISTNDDITRILLSMGFDDVFVIVKEPLNEVEQLGELTVVNEPDANVRQKVLDAHKILMKINEKNRRQFQDLVRALETE